MNHLSPQSVDKASQRGETANVSLWEREGGLETIFPICGTSGWSRAPAQRETPIRRRTEEKGLKIKLPVSENHKKDPPTLSSEIVRARIGLRHLPKTEKGA